MRIFEHKEKDRLMKKYGISPYDSSYEQVKKIMAVKENFKCTLKNVDEYNELSEFEKFLMQTYLNTADLMR